jgi:hypothetical protein
MLIWLASYPRSGNTFVRHLLYRFYGVRSYSQDFAPLGPITARLGLPPAPALDLESVAAADEMFFAKTHRLPGPDHHPALYLVRDGRDALVSYAHYTLHFDRGLPPESVTPTLLYRMMADLLRESHSSYGTWSANVAAWLARPDTAVLRFEELIARPVESLRGALARLGLELPAAHAAVPTFDELHALEPQFFRSGRVGAWRDELPPELLDLFWELNGDAMLRAGYGPPPARAA